MQAEYLAASPYNLVRMILGERTPPTTLRDNVYTRAAKYLEDWIRDGILAQDPAPGLYAYFQEFRGSRYRRARRPPRASSASARLEDYSANIVHRHEQTLSGPKKDRLELLRHTRAHFGQIFMLYPDPRAQSTRCSMKPRQGAPVLDVLDDYQARASRLGHRRCGQDRAHSGADGAEETADRRRPPSL